VLQVVSAARRQGGLQLLAPFLIGPGEPEHPVRGQAEVAQYRPEWLTRIDRVEEPLPHIDGEPLLRSGQPPGLLGVAVCPSAKGAVASGVPARRSAVACLGHRTNATGLAFTPSGSLHTGRVDQLARVRWVPRNCCPMQS
jgi:hypothetical protein